MSEHTKGPWEVYSDNGRFQIVRAGSVSYRNGITRADWIAEIDPDGIDHSRKQGESDANLIAAAPDLLAVCVMAVVELRHEPNCTGGAEWCAKCRARAALDKAEGRS